MQRKVNDNSLLHFSKAFLKIYVFVLKTSLDTKVHGIYFSVCKWLVTHIYSF